MKEVLRPLFAEVDLRVDADLESSLQICPRFELTLSDTLRDRPCSATGEFDTPLSTTSLEDHQHTYTY